MRKSRKYGGRRSKRSQRGGSPDLWVGDGFGKGETGYSWKQVPQSRRWTNFADNNFGRLRPFSTQHQRLKFAGGKKTKGRKLRKRVSYGGNYTRRRR